MNKDQFMGLLRAVLTCIGGVAVGHGLSQNLWEPLSGFALAAGALGWGVTTHDADLDQFMSVVRGAISAFGGFAIQKGWATSDQVTAWVGVAATLGPMAWTWLVHADPGVAAPSQTGGAGMKK
jgi:uncharacterized membrane protein YeaQ/YmgE (transglycosylase-associated protein family)